MCSPIGSMNFRKKTKHNITTERTPHSVHVMSYFDKVLDVVGVDAAAGKALAADPSPVTSPGADAAPKVPDSDPIGDVALERAHAHAPVAVVVGAGAADEGGGGKEGDEEENIDERSTYHIHNFTFS